jgi:hypothetical protein
MLVVDQERQLLPKISYTVYRGKEERKRHLAKEYLRGTRELESFHTLRFKV